MKISRTIALGFASVAMGSVLPAAAATNFFTNFDSYVTPGVVGFTSAIEGWNLSAGPSIEVQASAAGTPFSSPNLIELDSTANSEMSRAITAGIYALSFYYSPRPGVAASSNGIDVIVDSVGTTSFALSGIGNSNTAWTQYFVNFTTTAPTVLRFRAVGLSDALGGYIDDVRLTGQDLSAVPEASTWAMMLAGFGVVGSTLRRRRLGLTVA